MESSVDRSEIAFFDLETTFRTTPGQDIAILEFGSILVCPWKLVELWSYQTLVRPHDLSLISTRFARANGITADAVISAPTFSEVADTIYDILHGRVWAGHNIVKFDCVRLSEAYARINRRPPEPKGTIDSLDLLRDRFGKRAGDMKMASLGAYFELGRQTHRSLDDVRMNFEVLKCCATVLFLESILPEENSWVSPNQVEYGSAQSDPFDMCPPVDTMERGALQSNEAMQEGPSTSNPSNPFSEHTEFLAPDEVSIASIAVAPFSRGSQRIQLLHRDTTMQLRCDGMRVRFGLSKKFVGYDGRPRLSFVVDASSANLCAVLDECDNIVKRSVYADSNSEWIPVLKLGFYNLPTIRLHLPTVAGDTVKWTTEIYHKESSSSSSSTQGLVVSRYDVAELEALLRPGYFVDAYFSLDPYDYQHNAGIRLVAKKLIIHSN